ncbi:MAG: helix-turn-helix domain-containing protein [Candidatus Zixiibacteriota bacterium]
MRETPSNSYLSTGQAAGICSVTPDTVLKWIRSGRIQAVRTPGGHHRIPHEALLEFLRSDRNQDRDDYSAKFQYCWEFNSKTGEIPEDCLNCVVYKSKTLRCYEMSELPPEIGHARLFCQGTCQDCDYYRTAHGHRPNVLVVTDKNRLKAALEREAKEADFDLQVTDCEYRCSMMVEKFRPDYVVIDCSMGVQRSKQFASMLSEDPRIPFVRVILSGNRGELPKKCDKVVFAFMERPFSMAMLSNLIANGAS